eukprot:m.247897 g.247897  ORF g.247897 m.247897 type:complete len:432 (+) comp54262_c0_seq1:14-1309(+)
MGGKAEPAWPPRTTLLALLASQFLSLIGSDVAKFALRVWAYKSTNSIAQYSLLAFGAELPALLLSPALGLAVDRLPRKFVLLTSDILSALCTVALFTMAEASLLTVFLLTSLSSLLGAVHWTSFAASAKLMVTRNSQLLRFSSALEFAPALSMLFSPSIAGVIVELYGTRAALIAELVTCAAASLFLLGVAVPNPPEEKKKPLSEELLAGVRFVLSTPLLRAMFVLQIAGYIAAAALQVLTMPLLLAFTDAGMVGLVLTASGCGAMVGAAVSTALSPRIVRPVAAILVLQVVQGLLMIVSSLRASVLFIGCTAFVLMLLVPLLRACRLAVWQLLAPASMQGRVLLLLQTLMQAMLPLSAGVLGPLADSVFEPYMAENGIWADSLGQVFGTGRGRGAAVMMSVLGVLLIGVAAWAATRTALPALRIDVKKSE